jgi:uncharacterized protein
MGNFVINITTDSRYYFTLFDDNSKIILTSHLYSSKSSCLSGIDSVRNSCSFDSYERRHTVNKKHYFVLIAADGESVGKSEMYDSAVVMENGIESVRKNGNNINVVEEEPYF